MSVINAYKILLLQEDTGMTEMKEFYFPSADGRTNIRACRWTATREIKAIVQIVHGIAEHIERYTPFASFLAEQGIAVFGHDHLGHGKSVVSEEDRGYFAADDGWFKCVEDVNTLRGIAQKEYPGVPYFIFGHSMGSFLTRTYITKYADGIKGAVISGTGTNPEMILKLGRLVASMEMKKDPRIKSEMIRKMCFGSYNSHIENPKNENEWLSRDIAVSEAYCNDPLCGFLPAASLYRNMFEGISYIQNKENVNKVPKNLPMLFISGTEDPVGNYSKGVVAAFDGYKKAGVTDMTMWLYEGGRHEMLNETNKEKVWSDVGGWIEARI